MKNIVISLIGAFLLAGCVQKQESIQTKEYLPSLSKKAQAIGAKKGTKVAKIRNVTSQKSYLGNEMWYQKANERASFAYSKWAISPSAMISATLESSLEGLSVFKSVSSAHSLSASDFIIEATLGEFYQDFSSAQSEAILGVKLTILSTASGKVVSSKKFEYRQVCASFDAQGGVGTFGELLEKFSKDAQDWIGAEVGSK